MKLDRNDQTPRLVIAAALAGGIALACGGGGGATFGENAPGDPQYGGGTYLDDASASGLPSGIGGNGTIAVDPDTETVFTVQVRDVPAPDCEQAPCATVEEKRLVAVIGNERARELMNLDGYNDVRVLFPPDSVLVLAEPPTSEERVERGACQNDRCGDELHWFEKNSLRRLKSQSTNARYHGTRLSAKRNWLAVADNFQSPAPLHLVDTASGDINVVPQDGDWFEAMWLHREDVMISAHFSGLIPDGEDSHPFLTIREWFPSRDHESAIAGQTVCFFSEGPVPANCDSVAVEGFQPLTAIGFSWIGLSDDDRWVAVPAQNEGVGVIVVIDRETNAVEFLPQAYGPVGFTPDNRTMVAYGWDDVEAKTGAHLLVVDLETMQFQKEPVPALDLPSFFVSHDSNDLVAVNFGGGNQLILVDLDAGAATTMAGPAVATEGALLTEELAAVDPTAVAVEVTPEIAARREALRRRSTMRPQAERCLDRTCTVEAPASITLSEFVSRRNHRELWLIEGDQLMRLDLERREIEAVVVDASPRHINIQPGKDLLVIDSHGEQTLHFFEPDTRKIEESVSISLGWSGLDE